MTIDSPEVKIGFVSNLKANQVIPNNGLTILRNFKTQVGSVIEGYTKIPFDVHQRRDVRKQVEHLHGIHKCWCRGLVWVFGDRVPSKKKETHGVVGVDPLFLNHSTIGSAFDITSGFLCVTSDTYVEPTCALGYQRDEVEERDLDVGTNEGCVNPRRQHVGEQHLRISPNFAERQISCELHGRKGITHGLD